MSNTSKIRGWDMSSFNEELFKHSILNIETRELEFLIDLYTGMASFEFERQIELIKDELEFRNSPLGKELY